MTAKVQGNGTKDAQVTAEVTNQPPSIDRPAATAKPRRKRLRGPGGQFVAKDKGGAPAKNANAVTHGRRRAKTSRGTPANKDRFDRIGSEYAHGIWKRYGYPASPLKSALATKHAIAMRLHDQVGNTKPATRDGKLRGNWQNYTLAAGERDRLLERLEHRFRPDLGSTDTDEPHRFVALFSTVDGERAEVICPRGDEVERAMLAAEDKRTATKALEAAELPTGDESIRAYWCGRVHVHVSQPIAPPEAESKPIPPSAQPPTALEADGEGG